jgi:hypothetical protein
MVALAMLNSRMKDFYDLWRLAQDFPFDGSTLCQAIQATLARRRTRLPAQAPIALTDAFRTNAAKNTQWNAFLAKAAPGTSRIELELVVVALRSFLLPPLHACAQSLPMDLHWPAGGPWMPGREG